MIESMEVLKDAASAAIYGAQTKKSPVVFDAYEWDFGTIESAEGTVAHTFTFTNISKEAVKIDRDIPSCECVRAFYEDITVEPGEKAEVMVTFAPKKENGKSNLKPGETGKVEIVLNGESFQYYDPSIDELSTKPGRYQILYGTSSLDKDLKSIDFVVK